MRKSNVAAFVATSLAIGLVLACGSTPKPDTNTAVPSATPTTPSMDTDAAGPTASGSDAGGTADAAPAQSKEQQCEALQGDAQSEMDAERIKVDKACKKDADCMPIKGRACQFICTNGAIPKAEQADWDKEMTAVKSGPCKKWEELGCKKPDAKPPTCSDDKKKPACDKGHCILK